MRHDELVLALVLPDEQRHIFLIEELEAVSGQDAPDRVVDRTRRPSGSV